MQTKKKKAENCVMNLYSTHLPPDPWIKSSSSSAFRIHSVSKERSPASKLVSVSPGVQWRTRLWKISFMKTKDHSRQMVIKAIIQTVDSREAAEIHS